MHEWLENLHVECEQGDLLERAVPTIGCNVNQAMALNYRLGRQLAARGGAPLAKAIDEVRQELVDGVLPLGQVAAVPVAGVLPRVEQVLLFAWWGEDNVFSEDFIYRCLANLLRAAFRIDATALALPLFGTGSRDIQATDFARAALRVLQDFDGLKGADRFSLEALYFVSDRPHDVAAVDAYLLPRLWR